MQYYVEFKDDGNIVTFYVSPLQTGRIPETAVPITEEQWQMYIVDTHLYKRAESGDEPARLKTQEELDADVIIQPPAPKTPDQLMIEMLQVQSGELLFELAQAQDEREAQNMQMGMLLMQISAIQEGIG